RHAEPIEIIAPLNEQAPRLVEHQRGRVDEIDQLGAHLGAQPAHIAIRPADKRLTHGSRSSFHTPAQRAIVPAARSPVTRSSLKARRDIPTRSEEHTSELQSRENL